MKKKLVYISSIAAPHQLRLSEHLQQYFDTEFWFYDYLGSRPLWWKLELPPHCKVMNHSYFKTTGRYLSFELNQRLKAFQPDIVMLGGFFIPSNYFAYRWAKKHSKKVIVFTETFRKNGKLRDKNIWSIVLDRLYKDVDSVFTCHQDATDQMRRLLPTLGKRTYTAQYAADIDRYFQHPIREKKPAYTYLFPNRLIDIYNPLLAIDIFAEIQKIYPESILRINMQGELLPECQNFIKRLGLENNIQFLSDIKHWDDLSEVYKTSDILLFPAKFSNGNFTILESMASGMGIIVSNRIYGQTSLIKNGENGYLCDPDKKQFLHAVWQYINSPERFKKHVAINRTIVQPLSGAGTAELYAKLINQKVLAEI
ncbi:MAG: hypothetical protein BWK78_01155 [Thiotrichaceae bacterium IS1]|nr:MAG: hypothetical protein BWK78_01155 [Thiotrichaceae bacterium IS1]